MLNINRALNNGTFTENWFTDVEQLICLNPNINLQIVKKKKKNPPNLQNSPTVSHKETMVGIDQTHIWSLQYIRIDIVNYKPLKMLTLG